jgi:hypothetical protein
VVCVEEQVVLRYWSVALSVVMYLDEGVGLSGMGEMFLTATIHVDGTHLNKNIVSRKNKHFGPAEVNRIYDQFYRNPRGILLIRLVHASRGQLCVPQNS